MAIFEIAKTYNTTNPASFQVNFLKDVDGNDMTHIVDNEMVFEDHSHLKKHLSDKLQIPVEDIYVLEM